MNFIEIKIAEQDLVLRGEDSPEHLAEVADLVKRRVELLQKKKPSLSLEKIALLTAFDFASFLLKEQRSTKEKQSKAIEKATILLEEVEFALDKTREKTF